MFKKILVALDLVDSNEAVFEQAVALAQSTQSSLMLLHALAGSRDGAPAMPVSGAWDYYAVVGEGAWSEYQREWHAYSQQGLEMLRCYAEQAIAQGIPTEYMQIERQPGQAICALAQTWCADVAVVGSHGRTGLSELMMGSVSNYVTHHASCAVWVVRLNQHTDAEGTKNGSENKSENKDKALAVEKAPVDRFQVAESTM